MPLINMSIYQYNYINQHIYLSKQDALSHRVIGKCRGIEHNTSLGIKQRFYGRGISYTDS